MSTAWIRVRPNDDGSKSFQVLYRRGGRLYRIEHAGAFRGWPGGKDRTTGAPKPAVSAAEREARTRRDLIAGWLAQGLDPKLELARARAPRPTPKNLLAVFDDFIGSRVDVGAKAIGLYRNAAPRLGDLGRMQPEDIRPAHVQTWIASVSDLAPATIEHYLSSIRQALDYADAEPNPARSPKVRVPRGDSEEVVPPSLEDWQRIKTLPGTKPERRALVLLFLRLLEACALRNGEALKLTWGDIDFAGGELRISKARTKGRTAGQRWLPCPPALLDLIAALVPYEQRQRTGRVFAGLSEGSGRAALSKASEKLALERTYSPHDLRHRRISLWIAHGIDIVTIKTWAGHTKASMSSDTYGHVMISIDDEWRDYWLTENERARSPRGARHADRDAPVMPQQDG